MTLGTAFALIEGVVLAARTSRYDWVVLANLSVDFPYFALNVLCGVTDERRLLLRLLGVFEGGARGSQYTIEFIH
jgi:hypothetical protein